MNAGLSLDCSVSSLLPSLPPQMSTEHLLNPRCEGYKMEKWRDTLESDSQVLSMTSAQPLS